MTINDLVVRHVPGCGYVPLLIINGEEVYRGEFEKSAQIALLNAFAIYQSEYQGGNQ